MNKALSLFGLITVLLLGCNNSPQATLEFKSAWMRAAPPNANVAVVYGDIANNGKSDISLIAAYSPAFGAIEIHETTKTDGLTRMQRRRFVQIPANEEKSLEPGGLHLMMFRPQKKLTAGDKIWLCLEFSDGTLLEQWIPVEKK